MDSGPPRPPSLVALVELSGAACPCAAAGTEAAADRKLTRQLDRTLRSLAMLKDLVASLRKIDTRELASG